MPGHVARQIDDHFVLVVGAHFEKARSVFAHQCTSLTTIPVFRSSALISVLSFAAKTMTFETSAHWTPLGGAANSVMPGSDLRYSSPTSVMPKITTRRPSASSP